MITDVRQMHSMALETHRQLMHEADVHRQVRLARAARQGSTRRLLEGVAAAVRSALSARRQVTHS